MDENYDVVVVGGGAAGLSGALALARSRRSVLVVDAGEPRNAPAGHVHDYLTRDGTPPAELAALGRAEVTGYGAQVRPGRVTGLRRRDDGFAVELADGDHVHARRLLVATGAVDELPDVPGLGERWGRDVLHCPYCHGWEVRDRRIAVLATTPFAVHQALLFRQLSDDVTLLRCTGPAPSAEEAEQLAARGIAVVDGRVVALEVVDDRLAGVRLADGRVRACEALVVSPVVHARADLLAPLGLVPEPVLMGGQLLGTAVPADPTGATAVPGVWVAGNVTGPSVQVVGSAAAGLTAAARINADLVAEDAGRAVAAHRHADGEVVHDQAWWDERYRSAPQLFSGSANAVLVAEVADLSPGRALDAGAGEGGDALWLAERGWQVTALDLSPVALGRGARAAEQRGLAERIEWRQADLTAEPPPATAYDLVTSSFLHPAAGVREEVLAGLAAAVVPGGTLLVVAHDPSDLARGIREHARPEYFAPAEELARLLDPAEWEVQVAEARLRTARGHEGDVQEVADAVLRARRRPFTGASGRP
ncbi:SAM-dependent methyltransferase [Geodermatophilus sp. TF02-6]|uniref:bifunctional NAD(P)/FAD-dependent oxidoreductase/class I SAM-dependent methyltransferase n=1 Tax=Geodermatophilus sp. TF02-6 TaxID=2250575 RepID=UPI000DEBB480|nr:bifunctional NAD(P)/FAD-dependent oxidoreductase/class I SAM-dependent methyltransferase [Geodermatophilus sp. TF02-6]RBY83049.1 SAM-dependent methyltransferase [Geodermatophilus sp. TF02-6]